MNKISFLCQEKQSIGIPQAKKIASAEGCDYLHTFSSLLINDLILWESFTTSRVSKAPHFIILWLWGEVWVYTHWGRPTFWPHIQSDIHEIFQKKYLKSFYYYSLLWKYWLFYSACFICVTMILIIMNMSQLILKVKHILLYNTKILMAVSYF